MGFSLWSRSAQRKTRQEKVAKERAEIDEDAEVMAHQRVVSWIGELDMLDTGEGLDVGWC